MAIERTAWGAILLVLVAVAACSSDGSTESTTQTTSSGADTSTAESPGVDGEPIGPSGGEVSSDDGSFTVTVPAGALQETVVVSIVEVDAAEAGLDESLLDGPVFDLRPDGIELSIPAAAVRLVAASTLGIGSDEVPFMHVFHQSGDAWEALSTSTVSDGDSVAVSFELTHFSANAITDAARVWGEEASITLTPRSFVAETNSTTPTKVSSDISRNLEVERKVVFDATSHAQGAIVSYRPTDFYVDIDAVCGDVAGEGAYTVRFNSSATPDTLDALFLLHMGLTVVPKHFTLEVTGLAKCTEPTHVITEAHATTASGEATYTPVPGAGGSPFAAPFTIDIISGDGALWTINTEQAPRAQTTSGSIDPGTGAFITGGGDGATYYEIYFGQLTPQADGTLIMSAITFGGSDGFSLEWPDVLEEVLGNPGPDPFQLTGEQAAAVLALWNEQTAQLVRSTQAPDPATWTFGVDAVLEY